MDHIQSGIAPLTEEDLHRRLIQLADDRELASSIIDWGACQVTLVWRNPAQLQCVIRVSFTQSCQNTLEISSVSAIANVVDEFGQIAVNVSQKCYIIADKEILRQMNKILACLEELQASTMEEYN